MTRNRAVQASDCPVDVPAEQRDGRRGEGVSGIGRVSDSGRKRVRRSERAAQVGDHRDVAAGPPRRIWRVRASSADVSIVVLRPGTGRRPRAPVPGCRTSRSTTTGPVNAKDLAWDAPRGVRRVGDVTQQPFIERYSAKGVRRRRRSPPPALQGSACSGGLQPFGVGGPSVGEMAIRSLSSRGRSSTSRSRRIALAMFSLLAATRVALGTHGVARLLGCVPDQPPRSVADMAVSSAAISL